MSARCPRCGEDYFICGFCNSEMLSVEAVLLDENSCRAHYCSSICLDDDVQVLESVAGGRKRFGLWLPLVAYKALVDCKIITSTISD